MTVSVTVPLSDFSSSEVNGAALVVEVAAAGGLPVLAAVTTTSQVPADASDDATMIFDTSTPLTPTQLTALDVVIAAHDAPAALLAQTKADLPPLIDEHASMLNQSADKTVQQVDATRDTVKVDVAAATTPEDAESLTSDYLKAPLPPSELP